MSTSAQISPDAALLALRDKYRALAIETWGRFQSMLAKSQLSGITKAEQRSLGRRTLVLQARRDYYIGAAESISVLLGSEDVGVAVLSSQDGKDTDVPYATPSSDAISAPSLGAAVTSDTKSGSDTDVDSTSVATPNAISAPSSRCRDEAGHVSENSEVTDITALDSLTSPAAIDFGPEHLRSDESDVLPITPVATEETNA